MSVLIIAGPTGVGKSSLAFDIAKKNDAVLLCADAMTVYRGLDVGTAKPTQEEQQMVMHYGLDVCDIDQEFSVADFVALFDEVCAKHERVVVVGGTHFYLNALVDPMPEMPKAQPEIRARLEEEENLHQRLMSVDPEIADRLHPNDKRRIIRALEVYEVSGVPLSVHQKKKPSREKLVAPCLWLDRDDLRDRIFLRLQQMVKQGYWEECARIMKEGWDVRSKPLLSFSYRYMLSCLQENGDREEAIEKTGFGTWKLVRKQRTWGNGLKWDVRHPEQAWEWFVHNNPFKN